MTVTSPAPTGTEAAEDPQDPQSGQGLQPIVSRLLEWAGRPSRRTQNVVAFAVYVVGALFVTSRLWLDVHARVPSSNTHDFAFFNFAFTHAAHALVHFQNPLFNSGLNAPDGINMMANTSMLGLAIPLVPVTLLLGSDVSFLIATLIGFAGTAAAWYLFLRRHIGSSWPVALVAGGLVGFAPSMLSHGSGHPNLIAQFMVPLIISRVIQLAEDPAQPVRKGLILGLMIVYQAFLNEEILLYVAIICAVIAATYLLSRPAELRRLLRPFLVALSAAGGLAGVLLAYPLYFQFFGPQSYVGPFDWATGFGIDVASIVAYADESIGGTSGIANPLSANASEQNTFFGWPLCLFALAFGVLLWRLMAVRIALISGLFLLVCSLGDYIKFDGTNTGIVGPWRLVSQLPLFDSIIVTRMAMGVIAAIAIIVAIAADRIISAIAGMERGTRALVGIVASVALATTLVPIAPTPLPSEARAPAPAFFTNGTWREYVTDGSIVPVPVNWGGNLPMQWYVATKGEAWFADGYFVGPDALGTGDKARFGAPDRPTGELLRNVWVFGKLPQVTAKEREQAVTDLRFWQADIMVLGPELYRAELRETVTALLGREPIEIGGVLVWPVGDLVPGGGR